MIRKVIIVALSVFLLIVVTRCTITKNVVKGDPSGRTPNAEREFRAAWVATVANVNWPSKPGLPVNQQKKEAIELLDLLQNNNFNAVIFQVRPQCDALYQSALEPWSYYLTGIQGKAPDPFYDPLEFWIEKAHARGIELHAWLNPYRAHHAAGGEVTDASIVRKRPELVVKLEQGYWWMEPTKQAVQDQTYNVVMDLIRRYDLDGIHFDDYFYPYPSYNNDKDFPDDGSWQAYLKDGGKLSRGDWRRESVNKLVERIYKGIKTEKPWVKFGLSPFGIWRPYNPPSVSGFDQHNVLYADAKKWLNKGWVDYYSPQLYLQINQIPQSLPLLLG
ncbi:MAG: family 10 glycosylhydrolase [Bacteroidia bacterium]|nr:family 10 glycosylhydrolase [Bacteroidia bacterium]